ncbi:MAG: hypothetical protein H6Q68_1639 [Firmicutes bacterium]|nr:hypothetical protein [Bacillota bacterium]
MHTGTGELIQGAELLGLPNKRRSSGDNKINEVINHKIS